MRFTVTDCPNFRGVHLGRGTSDADPGQRTIRGMSSYAAARALLASVRWRNKILGAENIGRDV
jgi:hypothetical protein